jgi:adenylylsulfate kinase-like enzyme
MSWAVWITGRPGSGKSVIARAAVAELRRWGHPIVLLEVDRLLDEPEGAPGDGDPDALHRAAVYLSTALTGAGVPVVIDGTGHRRAWRELAREAIASFAEVQLVCPPEICQERERARRPASRPGAVATSASAGLHAPYEPALSPDLVVDTKVTDAAVAAARVAGYVRDRFPPPGHVAEIGRRWAIWITGLPGSGKTTVARGVARALGGRGIAVTVVEGRRCATRCSPDRRPASARTSSSTGPSSA